MVSTFDPHISVFSETDRDGNTRFHAVSAIMLGSCPTGRLVEKNTQGVPVNTLSRQIDLINSLYQANADAHYAIRYVSTPRKGSRSIGKVECCIFCRVSASNEDGARLHVKDQTEQLHIQLCSSLSDYVWQVVSDENEFTRLWRPLDWNKAHVAEVRRREELVALDSMRTSRRLGFTEQPLQDNEEEQKKVYLVHPYLPHPGQLERLLRLVLLNPATMTLTIILSPTILSLDEENGLLDEIAKSEGYKVNQSPNVQRLQQNRANMIGDSLMEQFLCLQDAPYYMSFLLASNEAIPTALMESAGVAVSASIGEGLHPIYPERSFIQMGGYDILVPFSREEKGVARNNLAILKQEAWGKTIAPARLSRIRFLMNGHQAVCAFRFPEDNGEGLPGINTHTLRSRQIPAEMVNKTAKLDPAQTLLVGTNTFMGITNDVYLPLNDRLRHMYLVGQTGTGKSTLMKTMMISDMQAGRGCALIDPHGDLFEEILSLVPPERIEDVVIIDPSDIENPVGMNLLEAGSIDERYFVVREMQAIMRRFLDDEYGSFGREMAGPIFFRHMQMNMLLAMSDPDRPGTLLEFYEIYQSSEYWKRWIPLKTDDPKLMGWIDNVLKNNNYTAQARGGETTMGDFLSSKFTDFIFDPRLRLIFGQSQSTFDLSKIMNEGKILLINLAKGLLGEANSRFLGLIMMAKIQAEAMKRAKMPVSKRKPYFIYVDEFQSLATENFTVMLSEARKFKIGLVLANQFLSQIKDPRIVQALFGNVSSLLSFRLGRDDAYMIEPQYLPYVDRMDLINLPNWTVVARTSVDGATLPPFTLQTILPTIKPSDTIAKQVREHSRKMYTRSRAEVEKSIAESLKNLPPV